MDLFEPVLDVGKGAALVNRVSEDDDECSFVESS